MNVGAAQKMGQESADAVAAAGLAVPPGYKHTELGVIPQDWDIKQLGELGNCIIGLTYKPSNVSNDGVLVLRSSNIQNDRLAFEDNVFVQMDVPEKLFVKPGDILVCVRNGSRALIGKCILIDEQSKGPAFGAFMSVYRSPYGKFIFNQFQSDGIKKQISENIGATINQITNKNLNSFKISFPSKEKEREAIVEALGDVDRWIASLDALIAKKYDIKTATMQQLLTGRTRLSGFSGEWTEKTFGELFDFLPTANNSRADLSEDGDIKYIHYGDIHTQWNHFIDFATASIPSISGAKIGNAAFIKAGDLIVADASEDYEGVAKSVEVKSFGNIRAVAGLHTFLLRPKSNDLATGFSGYIQSIPTVKKAINRIATGLKVYGVSKNNLREVLVRLPKSEEQTAIATTLSDMDAEIAMLETERQKASAIKQGMMQELLTGKTRLV